MYDLKELRNKKGFTWLVISEAVTLFFAIVLLIDGQYEVGVLLLILAELRSYIFTKVSI